MFIPLHVKSDCSLGFGTAGPEDLAARAAALGYRALALTDIENLYGQVRFHKACRKYGLNAITGVELRPGFDARRHPGRRRGRLVLLAADAAGYAISFARRNRPKPFLPIFRRPWRQPPKSPRTADSIWEPDARWP